MNQSTNRQLYEVLRALLLLNNAADKQIFSQHGLRRARYYILHHLYQTPHLTLGKLSEVTLLESASASRMIYSMEKEGLIERQTSETDRRLFTLTLTSDGRMLYEQVTADLDADIRKRFETLDEDTKNILLTYNQQLRDALVTYQAL